MSTPLGQRAVVVGGSMAGLLATRVLADAYAEVTVLDRDELATRHTQRRGVPQDRHIHALLVRGQQVLEDLFPGLTAALIAHGAPTGDMLNDARLYFNGHRLRQTASGLVALSASRAFLESHVRARVRTMTRVTSRRLATSSGRRPRPTISRSQGDGYCAGLTEAPVHHNTVSPARTPRPQPARERVVQEDLR